MLKRMTLIFLLSQPTAQLQANSESGAYEIPRTYTIPIQDKQTNKQYELYIKLPEDYEKDKNKKYPVIYFTDAIWHIETLSAATEYIMEESILVGISWQTDIADDLHQQYGAHASRFSDYSFWKKENPEHPKLKFGHAKNHLNFIKGQVFQYVENTYRTTPDNRSYFGYSLSGLFGAYALMAAPDTFKNYIIGSPSVQLIDRYKDDITFSDQKLNANVYIAHGDQETDRVEPIKTFVQKLKKRSHEALSIKYDVIQGNHQTAFPVTGINSISWLANLQEKGKQ